MPKKVEMWKCTYCGLVSKIEEDIISCEDKHQKDLTLKIIKLDEFDNETIYPRTITVLDTERDEEIIYEIV